MPQDIFGRRISQGAYDTQEIQDEMKRRGASRVAFDSMKGVSYEKSPEDEKRDRLEEANIMINTYDEARYKRNQEEGTHDFMSKIDEKGFADEDDIKEFNSKGKRKIKTAEVDDMNDLIITYKDGSTKKITKEMRTAFGKIRQKYGQVESKRQFETEQAEDKWKRQEQYYDKKMKQAEEKAEQDRQMKIQKAQEEVVTRYNAVPWDDKKHSQSKGWDMKMAGGKYYAVRSEKAQNFMDDFEKIRTSASRLEGVLSGQQVKAQAAMNSAQKAIDIFSKTYGFEPGTANIGAMQDKFAELKGLEAAHKANKTTFPEVGELAKLEKQMKDVKEGMKYEIALQSNKETLKALNQQGYKLRMENYWKAYDKIQEGIKMEIPGAVQAFKRLNYSIAKKSSKEYPIIVDTDNIEEYANFPVGTWVQAPNKKIVRLSKKVLMAIKQRQELRKRREKEQQNKNKQEQPITQ
jgi:hypothetical protein